MPLEIAKMLDEKELVGDELLDDLLDRTQKYEIKAIQDKRLIFNQVRNFISKVFGSFYTTEKESMVLITQSLTRLRENPHLTGREEKINQISSLMENMTANGLMGLKQGQSGERDFTMISQKLRLSINGQEEKVYKIVRKIPSARKAQEEEKNRLNTYREEIKLIEQIRLTCKQIDGLISQPLESEIQQAATLTVQNYFRDFEQKMFYALEILTGRGIIPDSFIAQIKLESLDLAEEMKDVPLSEKMILLASLNWYRHQWASRSFNYPDNLVYFLLSRMIARYAPWNPKGTPEIREALGTIGVSPEELEKFFLQHVAGQVVNNESSSSMKVNRKQDKIIQLVSQFIALHKALGSRSSVVESNTLLKKFLRPGIRTPVSKKNVEIIGQEIRSHVKMDCLSKMMRNLLLDPNLLAQVNQIRQVLSEAHMTLFQQLQAFRAAHGLSNLFDNKERERISAFVSPQDLVQFVLSLADGHLTVEKATEDSISFTLRGSAGEIVDTGARTLTSKGISYNEAAVYINKEFENLILNYEKPDFEARCADCNPNYEREKDHFVRIKQYEWVTRRYPFLKAYFGTGVLLVSPIMYNLMEGERDKEKSEQTIHPDTAKFMEQVISLEQYMLDKIDEATESFEVSIVDQKRVESEFVSASDTEEEPTAAASMRGTPEYTILLEEGVREVFPKVGFELRVLIEQSGGVLDDTGGTSSGVDERVLSEEERAFEEKFRQQEAEQSPSEEAPTAKGKISGRALQSLENTLDNLTVLYEQLRALGYEKRLPAMRRDQIVANVRDGAYYIKNILNSLEEDKKDAITLLDKTEKLLQQTRQSIQRVEIIEEKLEVEKENVEVPLYEIHSILVTISSSYLVTLQSLIKLIGQKHSSAPGGTVKNQQISSTQHNLDNIESAFNTMIRNSREIKLESPKIPTGLRDAMSLNIGATIGEINRLKRSQLIIQNCQHPNDLRVYLNVIARELLDRKLIIPLQNILTSIKKAPTVMEEGAQYALWRPEGEEKMAASAFGRMEIPTVSINDVPKIFHTVITISDSLADHLKGRSEELRQKMREHNQSVPQKTEFDDYSDRMTKHVSGILGQLYAFFVPDKENNITFDPENYENILRIIGTGVGELLDLIRDFNKNKAVFLKEVEALRKIAPVLEGVRNCVNDYNSNYLRQKKTADLARSNANCDKTLISYSHELRKFDNPASLEYKILIIRGRVYMALENLVQRVLSLSKTEYNAEKRKNYQHLVGELFYMMSHVRTEERDFPLFKKFMQTTMSASKSCGNEQIAGEVATLLEKGEEVQDWLKVAGSKFEESVVASCYTPGVDIDRLRKLAEAV